MLSILDHVELSPPFLILAKIVIAILSSVTFTVLMVPLILAELYLWLW
jgi:hypothetical protein